MVRTLLDECVDWRLGAYIVGHEVRSARDMRWTGLTDRALLQRAEAQFDVLVTVDGGLPSQQNLSQSRLMIVVLEGRTNRLQDLLPLVPGLLREFERVEPGVSRHVNG